MSSFGATHALLVVHARNDDDDDDINIRNVQHTMSMRSPILRPMLAAGPSDTIYNVIMAVHIIYINRSIN